MMGPEKSQRTVAREAFFIEFATETRKRFPDLVLMLTGGFRTRAGAESALQQNACDVIGIGRPAAIEPKLPLVLLDENVPDEEAQLVLNRVPMPFLARLLALKGVGAGLESVSCLYSLWYVDTNDIELLCETNPAVGYGTEDFSSLSIAGVLWIWCIIWVVIFCSYDQAYREYTDDAQSGKYYHKYSTSSVRTR